METTESKAVFDSKHQGNARQLKIPKMAFYDEIAGTFASEVVKACLIFNTQVKLGGSPYEEFETLYKSHHYLIDFLSGYVRSNSHEREDRSLSRAGSYKTIYEALLLWTNRHIRAINHRRSLGHELNYNFPRFVDHFAMVEGWSKLFRFESHAKALLGMDGRATLEL